MDRHPDARRAGGPGLAAAVEPARRPHRAPTRSGARGESPLALRPVRQASIAPLSGRVALFLATSLHGSVVTRTESIGRPGAEAAGEVVVDEARALHEGVADRRADEGEAAPLQIAREGR